MGTETCLCGEPINVDSNYLWSYGEKQIVIGCKACGYTGTKSARKVGAIVINTSNDTSNGGQHGAE